MNVILFTLAFLTSTVQIFGQAKSATQDLTGTWILDVSRSTFDMILFPGTPRNMKIVGQQLRIDLTASQIRLSGEISVEVDNKLVVSTDDTSLNLDGTEYKIGLGILVLRKLTRSTIETVSTMEFADKEYREISSYVLSPDGTTLTGTKFQTERMVASVSTTDSSVLRSSTFTLVFSRKP